MAREDVIDVCFTLSRNVLRRLSTSPTAKRIFKNFVDDVIDKLIVSYVNKDSIRDHVYHTPNMIKNKECPMCLDSIRLYSNIKVLECDHGFHVNCMDLLLQHEYDSCPICRHSF